MADKSAVTTTYNTDVHSIVRRYNRMLVEIMKSQSSGISQTMPFDLVRVKSYLISMRKYIEFIVGEPLLDCPETGPTEMPLPTPPKVDEIENESAYDVLMLITIARDELASSQSARIPTNLVKFDYDRQVAYLTKITNLVSYIEDAEPLDLPESSPMMAVSGSGRTGV